VACTPVERPALVPDVDRSSLRRIGQGELVGYRSSQRAHVWLGIPYARPPVGALRWRAPRPPEPWEGRLDARRFGAACVQPAGLLGHVPGRPDRSETVLGSEDCLTLNIYAPRFAPEEVPTGAQRLPVMVWFHGGGNTVGTSSNTDGTYLATEHGRVVVTVNYRLGVFGWLSHPGLAGDADGADDRSGNFGTLDQVRALEWVRDNVAAFGGDPGRVTIFGESAGARNVLALLASPRARGLFQRAIAQSGGTATVELAEARNLRDDAEAPGAPTSSGELLLSLLQREGRADDREAAKAVLAGLSPAQAAEVLRAQPDVALLDFYGLDGFVGMYAIPQLFRDGHVLPARPILEVFRDSGAATPVPVILGSNRDEAKLFMIGTSDAVRRVFGVPLGLADRDRYDRMAEYRSLAWKARAVDEPAAALRAAQGPTVYAYRFDWDEERRVGWCDLSELLGAAHSVEVPFVFGTLDLVGLDRIRFAGVGHQELKEAIFGRGWRGAARLARQMAGFWAEFARTGDPGQGGASGPDAPRWLPWDDSRPDASTLFVFDSEDGGGLRMSSDRVTTAALVERAEHDPAFRDERARCEFLAYLVKRRQGYGPADYAAGPCRGLPLPEGS
jgi:para-nitrobenzyl esterase